MIPSDKLWFEVQARLKNSIVQILVTQGEFDLGEPYMPPGTHNARGSGFIVSSEGHIITNAHVVANMLTLSIRAEQSGGGDLRANLIAICPAKDVALLKCHPDDLIKLGDFEPIEFGDDQELSQTQNVMVAGYPLGRRLTFTGGVVSGHEAPEGDASETSQSYIQVDAPMNPGNSGGPLITLEGKAVGINSAGIPSFLAQNTNFAIPSRVVLSVMRDMLLRESDSTLRKVVVPPNLGLTTQRVTKAHYAWTGALREEDFLGVMIKDVIKGSPFETLKSGDVLRAIKFSDPFHDKDAFNFLSYRNKKNNKRSQTKEVEIEITSTGFVKVYIEGEELSYTKDRRVSLQEILDTVPIDTILTLEILRKGEGVYDVSGPFRNHDGMAIVHLYPPFDKLDYLIFGGAVWSPLSVNMINALRDTKYICDYVPFERRYEARVIVTKLFPTSEMQSLEDINPTETLASLNDVKISTLDDMRKVIKTHVSSNSKAPWIFKFKSGKIVVLDKYSTIVQDKELHATFKIQPTDLSAVIFSKF